MTVAVFRPVSYIITDITNDFPAMVTTSTATAYTIAPTSTSPQALTITSGLIVRITVPWTITWFIAGVAYEGMREINNKMATIEVINDTQFLIDIDTRTFSAFATPPDRELPTGEMVQTQYAQVIPIGQANDRLVYAVQNILP